MALGPCAEIVHSFRAMEVGARRSPVGCGPGQLTCFPTWPRRELSGRSEFLKGVAKLGEFACCPVTQEPLGLSRGLNFCFARPQGAGLQVGAWAEALAEAWAGMQNPGSPPLQKRPSSIKQKPTGLGVSDIPMLSLECGQLRQDCGNNHPQPSAKTFRAAF